MNYRLAKLFSETTFSNDATEPIDLTLKDCISQLVIRFRLLNGGEANSDGHPMKCISRIELVDGSDILLSLSGQEAHALDWYSSLIERPNIIQYLPGNPQFCALHIDFGRFLYDPVLAFDPTKFDNPQLKITMDKDGGGMNNQNIILSVFAHLFDEKTVTPTGFLMSKEIKDFALGAGTHEYTGMPTDYPYRKILLRSQVDGTGVEYTFGNIKLSEDNDKKIPINCGIMEFLHTITAQVRPYREWIAVAGGSADKYFHCTPAYWPGLMLTNWEGSAMSKVLTSWSGDGGYARMFMEGAGGNAQALIEGWCPHGVIEIPFGLQGEIEDWYNVADKGPLQLDLTSGGGMSSSESCQVIVQQNRNYA